jgi:branched-chain amino acid transport system ATP-binding protein
MTAPLLAVERLSVFYGDLQILWETSLDVMPGTITTLIGANGAGKTTMLRAISGLLRPRGGDVRFEGRSIAGLPAHAVAAAGIAHVPEGRHVFPKMTVAENLALGAYGATGRAREAENLESVLALFPVLRTRYRQMAGTMSGGEQQMLAIARALMMEPKLVLMDEPSQGLQPSLVTLLFDTIRRIKARGLTVLLIEQNVQETLEIADRFYILESGRIERAGESRDMLGDQRLREAYLGL